MNNFGFSNSNSLNNKELKTSKGFSFLVTGHSYGCPSKSIYPSFGLVNSIPRLNALEPSFFLMLGDNVRVLDSLNIAKFKDVFLSKLEMPVFNAVGNHDLLSSSNRKDYKMYHDLFCKQTYYSYVVNNSLFIVLDSEISNGNIDGKQLVFLKNVLGSEKTENGSMKNIFICSHKILEKWKGTNFDLEIRPLLSSLMDSSEINVYMLSGDLTYASSDLYSYVDSLSKIRFIHSHLVDNKDDKILKFEITEDGEVAISPISLSGIKISDNIEEYPPRIVADKVKVSFMEKVRTLFINQNFYQGIFFGVLIVFIFRIARRL